MWTTCFLQMKSCIKHVALKVRCYSCKEKETPFLNKWWFSAQKFEKRENDEFWPKKNVFPTEGSQLFLRCAPFCSVLLFEHNCLGIRGLDISPKASWITVEICMPFQYNYAFYRMYSIHILSKRNIWLTKVLRNLVSRMCTLDRCQHSQGWVQLYFSRWSTVFTRFWLHVSLPYLCRILFIKYW